MRWVVPLLVVLTACVLEPHYKWQLVWPPSERVEWRVAPWETIVHYCGHNQLRGYTKMVACAVQIQESRSCFIYSYLTEEQAKVSWDLDGISIYEHEMKHCQGWRHQ